MQLHPCQKSNSDPEVGRLFTLVLGLAFMQFDPQLINKLLISLIWPLIRFNYSLYLRVFFILVLGFEFI